MGKLMAFILLWGAERKYIDANSSDGCDPCNNSRGANSIVHNERDFRGRTNVLPGGSSGFRGSGTVRVGEQASRLGSRLLYFSLDSFISP